MPYVATLEAYDVVGPSSLCLRSHPEGGLATTSFESDVPISYQPFEDIYTPVSTEIKHWRVLHIAGNCANVQSDRNGLISKLDERLVDCTLTTSAPESCVAPSNSCSL